RAHAALPAVGFASIGAGLDFLAGTQVRAPAWVRKMALEWAWRLATNPGRMAKRYLDCALILPRLALTAFRQRRAA
ncbi:MAG: WecB/TagA/CpsF family glycosyltransferase, partial [Pseudomonadota bacterium]